MNDWIKIILVSLLLSVGSAWLLGTIAWNHQCDRKGGFVPIWEAVSVFFVRASCPDRAPH